ncbi:MAG: WYL domain-containing protein [Nitrospirae bacterium]|nr:WYL domain-containing protein [Nitrospirota bacterium]
MAGITYRPPTYGAAARFAQIMYGLQQRPLGWSLEAMSEDLRLHPRTIARYAGCLTKDVEDNEGRPLIILEERYGKPHLRLAAKPVEPLDLNASLALSLYAATTLLRFTRGSRLYASLEAALQKALGRLSPGDRMKLMSLERKIHYVPDGPKDYSNKAIVLERVVEGLLHQRRLKVKYTSLSGGTWESLVHPYSLMMYKRGLYIIGHSEKHGDVRYLAIERIDEASITDAVFNYPVGYRPGDYTDGCFGIIDGDPVDVSIRFKKGADALITGRVWHPTQKITRLKNGDLRLTMRVRGTDELLPWVMSHGPYAKVEAPAELRSAVKDWLAGMKRGYRFSGP